MENPALPVIPPLILLHILSFNWTSWSKQLKLKCQAHFGMTGIAILNGTQLTLTSLPHLDDVNTNGKLRYPVDADGELTNRAFTVWNIDNKRAEQLSDLQKIDDNGGYQYILSTLHPSTITSFQNSPGYAAFLQLPQGNRATACLAILQSLCSTTDAATKNRRALEYFNSIFEHDISSSLDKVRLRALQFLADFGSTDPNHIGFIDASRLECFVMCRLLEHDNYRNLVDRLLSSANTTLDDPASLSLEIINYDTLHRNQFVSDSTSDQGQSFLSIPSTKSPAPSLKSALKTTTPPPNPSSSKQHLPASTQSLGDKSKPHCPHCLTRGKIRNHHGVPGKPPCVKPILAIQQPYRPSSFVTTHPDVYPTSLPLQPPQPSTHSSEQHYLYPQQQHHSYLSSQPFLQQHISQYPYHPPAGTFSPLPPQSLPSPSRDHNSNIASAAQSFVASLSHDPASSDASLTLANLMEALKFPSS